ncbi:heavy metal sensor histidine kinase [Vibrio tubiashii]|uniref:heavy metal sensor histidine kinase n=1 Tax=Vibrio tubiashii TaxID=29498 RepID=UPI003CE50D7C
MSKKKWFNSISGRLNVSYFCASLLVLCCVNTVLFLSIEHHFYQQDHHVLTQKFATIDKLRIEGDFISKFGSFFSSSETKLWLISNNELIYRSQPVPLPNDFSLESPLLEWSTGNNYYRGQLFKLENSPDTYAILGIGIDHHRAYLQSFGQVLLLSTIIASLVSGFLGFTIVSRELAPLKRLEAHMQMISTNKLDIRIPLASFPKELLPLVDVVNQMLTRLECEFERLSDFSSDIAHELRTPLANMMTQTHVTLSKVRSIDEYQNILVSSSEELNRLNKTISDILYLAKSDHNLLMKSLERLDLANMSEELIGYYELAGEDKSLSFKLVGHAEVVGDRTMIKRAISNLLSNAVRHSNEGSTITIKIQRINLITEVSISNEGDPIPTESLPHLFRRFYRVDKSRAHSTSSGSGLGLPIARSIAQLHNGDVSVTSEHNNTIFTLSLKDLETS